MNPIVSVIIPTYNCAHLIKRAVESVLSQSFQDFELIIVDDGSKDNTMKIVKELISRDNRIEYIRLNKNSGGAAKPKNTGISNSKGKYIAILDSDDEWYPTKIEKQINIFKKRKSVNLGFVSCFARHIYEEDGVSFLYKIPRHKNILRHILARDYMGSGSGMLYMREVFDKVGGFDENLQSGQDSEMRIRLSQYYDFDIVEEELFAYHLRKESISNVLDIGKRMEDINYIIRKWNDLYKLYPQAHSDRLRFNGTSYMIAGKTKEARRLFFRAIIIDPFYWRNYFYLLASFLGQKIYKKITIMRVKYIAL
jgi:glycosyltransferase involved in cell wall biosynthesis